MLLSKLIKKPINKKRVLYKKISTISALFAGVHQDNFHETINTSLKILGDFVGADRTYIFRYDFDKNTTSNTFEYSVKGISKEIENLQNVPIDDISNWVKAHQSGKTLYFPNINKLPEDDQVRKILEPQSIKSIMTVPLIYNDELYGFLGFDSVKSYRKYSNFEQTALKEFSYLLVNVLKRIELEQALKDQQLRLDYILDAANIGAWEWDLETNKTNFSKKWAELIGYKPDELKPFTLDTWKQHTNKNDLKKANDKIQATLNNDQSHYESVIRMKHKKGHDVWIKDVGTVIRYKNNTPLTMMGVHIDISELIMQQKYANMIKQALEYSQSMVVITDISGIIQYVNARFISFTGYTKEDVIGKTPRVLKSGYHDSSFYTTLWQTITEKKEWSGEFYNQKKNGEKYWEQSSISPVLDEQNNITYFIAVKKDITKEKNIKDQLAQKRIALKQDLEAKMADIKAAEKASIIALAKLTESRDYDTGKHIERVQHLAKNIAKHLRNHDKFKSHITNQFIDDIYYASALHDIGKINIPDNVLLKEDSLTNEEYQAIKSHVVFGAKILLEMARYYPDSNMIIMGSIIAKYHHEKWDGSGYPDNLKGEAIPLEARIMGIVDVYDALRSKRPYKPSYTHEKACKIIKEAAGKHFDPDIVQVFQEKNRQIESIYESLA
ncbi:MAG: PAS domain S-box protein [Bacillota bacterium]